jgi:hypothetical protein
MNPVDEDTVGSVDSSSSRKRDIVSRVAAAAAASNDGLLVAIERFVSRNDSVLVTDCSCADTGRGILRATTVNAVRYSTRVVISSSPG